MAPSATKTAASKTAASKTAASKTAASKSTGNGKRPPSVDALAGLDLKLTTGVDVPDTLRTSAVPNPFDGIVKTMADALRANDNKVVKDKGASTFTLPGGADEDKNAALKQAILKLNKAGATHKVSVVKSKTENKDNTVTVLFYVRPRITRKTATSAPEGVASGSGAAGTS